MTDRIVETSTRGYGSRILESIKAVLVGIVFFLVSFPLLWWNEGRAVQAADSFDEGSTNVVSVPSDRVDPANEGKLVHVSGAALVHELLRDPVFAVSAEALRLTRVVEMFEWQEEEKTETTKNVGGSDTKTTTYLYSKKWSDRLVDSSVFKQRADHTNPTTMPYDGKDMVATDAKIGAFALPEEAIKRLAKFDDIAVDDAAKSKLAPELAARAVLSDGKIFLGKSVNDPAIGDVRISFRMIRPQLLSVIAQQFGASFRAYPTKAGDGLFRVDAGAVDASKMFAEARSENVALTWGLRGLGFCLMVLGLSLFFRPIATVADFIPKIGSFVGFSAVVFSVVLAGGLSAITIAVAWIAHRPLLGIAVLLGGAAALAGVVLMMRMGKRRKRVAA